MEKQRSRIAKNYNPSVMSLKQWAHDVRSPLLALDALARTADGLLPGDKVLLNGAVERIRGLSAELLTALSFDTRAASHSEPSLFDLVEQVMREKWLEISTRPGITIETRIAPQTRSLNVAMPATDLQRILSNLLNNAIEAVIECGRITLSVSATADRALLLIEDTGEGFAFDPALVQSGRIVTTKVGGNGLGLSHACAKIEAYGGSLRIESERGRGSRIFLELPL